METKLKIFIVDDHEFFRNGLKMVINRLKYARVAGEASNGREFLDLLAGEEPDVVLIDIQMPVMNGIEATRLALEEYPDLKVVALTMFDDEEYIQSMIDAGAKGFLLKNITKDILDQALTAVYSGKNYYSPELFDFFTRKVVSEPRYDDDEIQLTRREKEILQLICDGLSNKEIADKLFISERTVVGHKSNLLAKTNCKSSVGLLSYAIRNRLVEVR
ncbi:MAG: response regulator transcription factor [Bacteroidales bacterium]|jgi:DNA-binding NarL/FixJ family response regulator|nr:response regulator transcription factor [Bacteroidales bacterium]